MRNLLRKTRNKWKNLSFTLRNDLKWKAAGAVLLAAGLTFLAMAATGGLAALGIHIALSALAGATYASAISAVACAGAVLPGLIKEIRHGQKPVTWKNDIGQTIESTQSQQKDLREYASYLKQVNDMKDGAYFINRHSKEMRKFNRVADKVTVKADVSGNMNNRFRFYTPPAHTYNFDPQR